jgi:hypothetical protein
MFMKIWTAILARIAGRRKRRILLGSDKANAIVKGEIGEKKSGKVIPLKRSA